MFKGFYRFANNFMKWAGLLFTALIFVSAFLFSAHNAELSGHFFTIERDNLILTALGMIFIFALGLLLYMIFKNNMQRSLKGFLIFTIAWYLMLCEYMAFFGRSMPNSDSWIVYAMAKQLAAGDLSIINPTTSYMSYYPQQIGLCAFLSVFIRILGLFKVSVEEFHFLAALYGIFESITIFFLYKTINNLFESPKINFIFLYLSLFNFPYIVYSSYIYGEIPALMFFSVGAFFLTRLFKENGRPLLNIVLSTVSLALSVWVRKNSLILIIAVLIVLLFEAMSQKNFTLLLSALLIGIASFSILPLTVKYYEAKAESTLSTGVTALSYVAMGMQETSGEGASNPGWYNGFNFDTFEDSGYDTNLANEISKEAIKNRISEFKADPKEALDFYKGKFITQWVDGTYFSLESTYVYYGERSGLLMSVYYGNGKTYYVYLCNLYQAIVFLGAFLYTLTGLFRMHKEPLWKSVLLIAVFGGFLFHMIWEANSRYILTYACLLVPLAAAGYGRIFKDSYKGKHRK